MKGKYFKEDIVGECTDSHPLAELVYTPQISDRVKEGLRLITHEEIPWSKVHVAYVHRDFWHLSLQQFGLRM